jgi:hypothetical protein
VAIKRLPNGRWEASYRDPAGKEKVKYFPTRAAADRFLASTKADMQRGDYVDRALGRTPLRQWADEWMATTAHLRLKTRSDTRAISGRTSFRSSAIQP